MDVSFPEHFTVRDLELRRGSYGILITGRSAARRVTKLDNHGLIEDGVGLLS